MNRTQRKARKMFRRRYSKATNPFWQVQPRTPRAALSLEAITAAMRSVYAQCSSGAGTPEHAVVSGELVNLALSTHEHEDAAAYHIGPDGITKLTE